MLPSAPGTGMQHCLHSHQFSTVFAVGAELQRNTPVLQHALLSWQQLADFSAQL